MIFACSRAKSPATRRGGIVARDAVVVNRREKSKRGSSYDEGGEIGCCRVRGPGDQVFGEPIHMGSPTHATGHPLSHQPLHHHRVSGALASHERGNPAHRNRNRIRHTGQSECVQRAHSAHACMHACVHSCEAQQAPCHKRCMLQRTRQAAARRPHRQATLPSWRRSAALSLLLPPRPP